MGSFIDFVLFMENTQRTFVLQLVIISVCKVNFVVLTIGLLQQMIMNDMFFFIIP